MKNYIILMLFSSFLCFCKSSGNEKKSAQATPEEENNSYRLSAPQVDDNQITLRFKGKNLYELEDESPMPNIKLNRNGQLFSTGCVLSPDGDTALRQKNGVEAIRYTLIEIKFIGEKNGILKSSDYSDSDCKTLWLWEDGDDAFSETEILYEVLK
ncbi:MAG: hypothetical protein CMP11_02645 [Zetaproteobacteria bacterium]|nr:hypothetical protein [Pseudobdellovibrionaceae bacterium]